MINIASLVIVFFLLSISTLFCQNSQTKSKHNIDTNMIYSSYLLDEQPRFKAGNDSLNLLIFHYIVDPSKSLGYEGVVSLCLKIDKKGDLVSIHIPGETENMLFSEFSIGLQKKINHWEPGKKNGINVKSMICLPVIITFR